MTNKEFAELLFPEITLTPEDYEKIYPPRNLPEGAKVTRMAPSPTGFMHLGNLFGAIADERLAHLSGGIFYLRIEDTDLKRQVEGGVDTIIDVFNEYNLSFDEGATKDGEIGAYGPYRQRQREKIYKAYAKDLVAKGLAYPCFCTEDELEEMRKIQEQNKENFGYYGKYAKYRSVPVEELAKKVEAGIPYVLRFKSMGNPENRVKHSDLIKGELEFPENDQDIVILKSDGIPTYHFAHVIDDHLMRTTVVVRGEEWLSTLPIHIQLFDTLGFKRPKYAHTAQLMKMDGQSKRKLSKRKDPELALSYYNEVGYPVASVTDYLLTLLNSNFEDWRKQNPKESIEKFNFTTKKMSVSGSLFDIDKLRDVSKNVISLMDAETVYSLVLSWSKSYDNTLYSLLSSDKELAIKIFEIGRGGKKPRKDIAVWSEVKDYISFFYDEIFTPDYNEMPDGIDRAVKKEILLTYKDSYKQKEDMNDWFNDLCQVGAALGFAPTTKGYKENPGKYKGNPADVSQIIRVAVTGRQNSPDLFTVMNILGCDKVKERLDKAAERI